MGAQATSRTSRLPSFLSAELPRSKISGEDSNLATAKPSTAELPSAMNCDDSTSLVAPGEGLEPSHFLIQSQVPYQFGHPGIGSSSLALRRKVVFACASTKGRLRLRFDERSRSESSTRMNKATTLRRCGSGRRIRTFGLLIQSQTP